MKGTVLVMNDLPFIFPVYFTLIALIAVLYSSRNVSTIYFVVSRFLSVVTS